MRLYAAVMHMFRQSKKLNWRNLVSQMCVFQSKNDLMVYFLESDKICKRTISDYWPTSAALSIKNLYQFQQVLPLYCPAFQIVCWH